MKIVPVGLLSLMLLVGAMPTSSSHTISCSDDPCATTYCDHTSRAEAHAYGSEWSWASVTINGGTTGTDGQGGSHADGSGPAGAAVSATAKGKKDWSLLERNSSCSIPAAGPEPQGILPEGLLGLGCVADERITQTAAFTGVIHVGAQGLVAYDAATGQGLALDAVKPMFHGRSLEALAPVAVATMVPTSLSLAIDLVEGGDEGTDACAVRLF